MIDWNIQSRSHACQACDKPFSDKQPFHTLLFDQKRAYQRLDVCDTCWTSQYGVGASDRKGFISYWQSVYSVPPPPPPEPIQKETAESLLRKIIETHEERYTAARFILAVMLERKRLLKVKAQLSENNQRILVYEHVRTGDLFNIPDPDLQLDQLEEVQRDVARLLEHGLNPPDTTGSQAAPDSSAQPAAVEDAALSDGTAPIHPEPAVTEPTSTA